MFALAAPLSAHIYSPIKGVTDWGLVIFSHFGINRNFNIISTSTLLYALYVVEIYIGKQYTI
jgi:hypothetical protein